MAIDWRCLENAPLHVMRAVVPNNGDDKQRGRPPNLGSHGSPNVLRVSAIRTCCAYSIPISTLALHNTFQDDYGRTNLLCEIKKN